MSSSTRIVAAGLLHLAVFVSAHGSDTSMDGMEMGASTASEHAQDAAAGHIHPPSYAGLSEHSGLMISHIGIMVLAWVFVLPVGIMFSIARSRYTLPVQLVFLATNGVGVALAIAYNVSTPDLYENNAHHTIGWVVTWMMAAQTLMSLLFVYSGRASKTASTPSERAAFLPVSTANMAEHNLDSYHNHRWSADSGTPTCRSSTTLNSPRNISPSNLYRLSKEIDRDDDGGVDDDLPLLSGAPPHASSSHSRFRIKALDNFLSRRAPDIFSRRVTKIAEIGYEVVDRTILILGFSTILSGGVVFFGWFRDNDIFNGMAHFVKGGIFFWYGLLTLGRWLGCFSSWGWAWQMKPTQSEVGKWNHRMPSAEFTESVVIWLYGASTIGMEHLAAGPDGEWAAVDLEHVSISVMFFGGGLLGMLVESKTVRTWLNTSVEMMPSRQGVETVDDPSSRRQEPRTYNFTFNPVPALIIMLLGITMSSHHQDSMVSTAVHAQWGTLLSGFAISRIVTYLFLYVSPPTSIYPSRPPSEVLAAFCLISGGLIFMASTRDVIIWMEERNLMAMFVFTVVMGFTCFLMAWTVIVLALKGWVVRRERRARS